MVPVRSPAETEMTPRFVPGVRMALLGSQLVPSHRLGMVPVRSIALPVALRQQEPGFGLL